MCDCLNIAVYTQNIIKWKLWNHEYCSFVCCAQHDIIHYLTQYDMFWFIQYDMLWFIHDQIISLLQCYSYTLFFHLWYSIYISIWLLEYLYILPGGHIDELINELVLMGFFAWLFQPCHRVTVNTYITRTLKSSNV